MLSLYLALSSQNDRPLRGIKKPLKRPIRALKGRTASNPRLGPQRGLRKAPRWLYGPVPDSQTFGGIRPARSGHPYRGGGYRLTPAAPGLRAPARRERLSKPRALSGRGDRLYGGLLAFSKTVQQWRAGVKGQPGGRSPERSGGTGRGLGRVAPNP